MMAIRFGNVDVCSYCNGKGSRRRGSRWHTCPHCSGRGILAPPLAIDTVGAGCVCACMCETLTSSIVCDECMKSHTMNGVCERIVIG
jgi:hypothetical protein